MVLPDLAVIFDQHISGANRLSVAPFLLYYHSTTACQTYILLSMSIVRSAIRYGFAHAHYLDKSEFVFPFH